MADQSISTLPAVATPATSDILVVVQGGVTKRETALQLLAATTTAYQAADTTLDARVTTLETDDAPLASPALTGVPTAPTAAPGTNTTQLATTAFVTTADNLKLNLTGGTMSGAIAMGTAKITGMGNGTTGTQDAATVIQVETLAALNASYLEAYNPAVTSAFPTTWGGGAIAKGDRYYITTAGTVDGGGTVLAIGDVIEAYVAPFADNISDWVVIEGNKVQATTTVMGIVETATDAEAVAKASTTVALTPSNLAAGNYASSETFPGLVEIATQAETNTGTDDTRLVTPLKLSTYLATLGNWSLTGNAGTVDVTNFIGTTDGIPLSIRVNNQRSGRIDHLLFNTFYGYKSGEAITTGNQNTLVGHRSGESITTQLQNTALGYFALLNTVANQNTAIGQSALEDNGTGTSNTAVGVSALLSNTIGNYNVGIGRAAGATNITGSSNTCVGDGADVLLNNLTNATAIGANSVVNTSNSLRLGDGAVRVGIGTGSPNASSILDLTSTTGSLLIPRMTTAQKNALTPVAGMIVYDSTLGKFQGYEGAAWTSFI